MTTDDSGFRLHDLGPLQLSVGGELLPVSGAKPSRILCTLLVNANRTVAVDTLVNAVWGEHAAISTSRTLETYVWRLRKMLEPRRGPREPATRLVNSRGGYRLIVDPEQADSLHVAQLADQGDASLDNGDADRALRRYDRALGLWRGRPFDSIADEPWAMASVARLERLNERVGARRAETLLALGLTDQAIAALQELIAESSFSEKLWAQLMLALYQAGRVEDALITYRRARQKALDELGLEPGAELTELHRRILEQDPDLSPPTWGLNLPRPSTPDGDGSPVSRVGLNLPIRLSEFVGRETELERLTRITLAHRLVTVVGAGGCGKTRLAIEVAQAAASAAPDGVWFIDLSAVEDPATLADVVVSTLGLAPSTAGGARSALQAYVAEREILLLLDNCEHILPAVQELVGQLLTPETRCRILATSREPLDIDGEMLWPLGPMLFRVSADTTIDTDAVVAGTGEIPMSTLSEAALLFVSRVAALDPTFEPGAAAKEHIEDICEAVDGIPLAIELAAGRIRTASLTEIRDEVSSNLASLSRLGRGHADHHRTVEMSVDWSTRALSEKERTVHARLAVLPGAFTTQCAAAAAGFEPVTPDEVPEVVRQLTYRSLLTVVRPVRDGGPTRFRQLATVRAHAARNLMAARLTDLAAGRRDEWVAALVARRPRSGSRAEGIWMSSVDDDRAALRATLQHNLVERPGLFGASIAGGLPMYWYYRGLMIEGTHWIERAAAVADSEHIGLFAVTHLNLAAALVMSGRYEAAQPHVATGLDTVAEVDQAAAAAVSEALFTLIATLGLAGRPEEMADVAAHLRSLAARHHDARIDLLAEVGAATADSRISAPTDEMLTRLADLWQRSQDLDDHYSSRTTAGAATLLTLRRGEIDEGLGWSNRTLAAHLALGLTQAPVLLEVHAGVLALSGDAMAALRLFAASRAHSRRIGLPWPQQQWTAALVDTCTGAVTPSQAAEAEREGAKLDLADLAPLA